MAKHTAAWYEASTGNHQGLVIEEGTGRNVAVAYDKQDAALIASAPSLLAALEAVVKCLAEHITDEARAKGIDPKRLCPCTEFQLVEARAAIRSARGE